MAFKHWFEPRGIFIFTIPANWQYRNDIVEGGVEGPPYSFTRYENLPGAFQISCYPISEKGNPNFKTYNTKTDSSNWIKIKKQYDDGYDIVFFYAQIDDQFFMAKYIDSIDGRDIQDYEKQLKHCNEVLSSLTIVPESDRELAVKHKFYDNFIGSIGAAHDLRFRAIEGSSLFELIILTSNIIDGYLRLAIVLRKQIIGNTDDFNLKYLFEGVTGSGKSEGKIYKEANELSILSGQELDQLNELYKRRNKIVHRYIISKIRTVEVLQLAVDFEKMMELVRYKLEQTEHEQIEKGIGLYGVGYQKDYLPTEEDRKIAYSMANDKHLLKYLRRQL